MLKTKENEYKVNMVECWDCGNQFNEWDPNQSSNMEGICKNCEGDFFHCRICDCTFHIDDCYAYDENESTVDGKTQGFCKDCYRGLSEGNYKNAIEEMKQKQIAFYRSQINNV